MNLLSNVQNNTDQQKNEDVFFQNAHTKEGIVQFGLLVM